MECVSLFVLFKYLKDQEDSDERTIIIGHLSTGCPACHENLQWLDRVIAAAKEDQSFEFSEETLAAIVAQFKKQVAASLQPIRQYIARLIFDSGIPPLPADARSRPKKYLVRRMLYDAEGYDIDLKFTWFSRSNDERLVGQVLSEHCDAIEPVPFKIELLQRGLVVSFTATDESGVFAFHGLTSGTYEITITVPDGEINLKRVSTAYAL